MLVEYAGLRLELPEGWSDITPDLPPDSPFTLARATGGGALQFSVAEYKSGVRPNFRTDDLRRFFKKCADANGYNGIEPKVVEGSVPYCIGAEFSRLNEVVGMWYLSDGSNIAFITYNNDVSDEPNVTEELADIRIIVKSIKFTAFE
jgi:hypothetical protein